MDGKWTFTLRLGWAEVTTATSLLAVAAALAVALAGGWGIAAIPGLTYALGIGAAYTVFRRYGAEHIHAEKPGSAGVTAFRVTGTRGLCPRGRRDGDLLLLDTAGGITPEVCPLAAAVLNTAARDGVHQVEEWCCPVFDHLLVFRREPQAA